MSPIRIEDLPPDRPLTPEELEKLQGAGRRSPNLEIEGLENREMFAAHLGAALPMGPQAPAHTEPAEAHIRTVAPQNEVQVLGMPAPKSTLVKGEAINPLLAPSQAIGRQAFEARYESWWNAYQRFGGDWNGIKTIRIARPDQGEDSVSEGTAYGMLMTVNSQSPDARDRFDRLFAYAQKNFNQNGLMAWQIGQNGTPIDRNAATDADQDMAMALILANKRWGDAGYRTEATKLINAIMQHEVQAGTNVLLPGDGWGADGPTHINVSYFSPAYYRLFKEFSGDARWDAVREKCYDLLKIALSKSGDTGLVPDWMTQEGDQSPDIRGQDYSHNQGYDAVRTPWRFALDAVWYGDERAISYLKTVNNFFKKVGVQNIQDKYQLNGQPGPGQTWVNAVGVSMAATAAIVDGDQAHRQQFWTTMTGKHDGLYFNDSLQAMSMMFTSNLMAKPVF